MYIKIASAFSIGTARKSERERGAIPALKYMRNSGGGRGGRGCIRRM